MYCFNLHSMAYDNSWEIAILDALQNMHSPWLDKLMIAVTSLGNAGILWIIMTVILLIIPKTRKTGLFMAAALLVEVILANVILKNFVARTRPYEVVDYVSLLIKKPVDYSFPSGHTGASFAAVTALFLCRRKLIGGISLVIAALIAFSRMYLYVHFPTDVIGGVVVGIVSGICGYFIIRKIDRLISNKKGNETGCNAADDEA